MGSKWFDPIFFKIIMRNRMENKMQVKDLTIEYRKNPIGLDVNPRFSWKLESDKQNVMQRAYHVQVWKEESPEDGLEVGKGTCVWDSKKVEGDKSVLVPYQGEELWPFTKYRVEVTVWDLSLIHI